MGMAMEDQFRALRRDHGEEFIAVQQLFQLVGRGGNRGMMYQYHPAQTLAPAGLQHRRQASQLLRSDASRRHMGRHGLGGRNPDQRQGAAPPEEWKVF